MYCEINERLNYLNNEYHGFFSHWKASHLHTEEKHLFTFILETYGICKCCFSLLLPFFFLKDVEVKILPPFEALYSEG